MKFRIFTAALFASLVSGELWAQFCDDAACSENCGQSVSVSNDGCLANEGNRRSLSFSPSTNCGCQSACMTIVDSTPSCTDITSHIEPAQSYRFQEGNCYDSEARNTCGRNATAFQD
ncbi:hypothetical protein GGR53DRAFT_466515 [Hypoxylon sp. FL1150]|nr:hypothetical protein GGR53DRAFT_466515 [Hypoxylon sp. FL1150]